MEFLPIKTCILYPPQDDIYSLFDDSFPPLQDWDVLFITSKIVAIHQWRCVSIVENNKDELIKSEAQSYLKNEKIWLYLTITNNILIPSAGIDESNSDGYYILFPQNLDSEVKKLANFLKEKYQIQKLWIVITDSTSQILKLGVVGTALYSYGFHPLIDRRGSKDLFGKELAITRVNVVESLSAMAVFLMGESSEQTPMLIARWVPHIQFSDSAQFQESLIEPQNDLYAPLLSVFPQ